jgi:hypothetical protein
MIRKAIKQIKTLGAKMWNLTFQVFMTNPLNAVAHTHEERKSLKRRGIEPLDFETAKSLAQLNFRMKLYM